MLPLPEMWNLSPILTRLLLAVLALAVTAPVQAQDGVATDRAALVALYNATNGGSWADDANWRSDEPLSSWYGVTTNGDGRVTRPELDDNDLRGRLPAALGDLSELERLHLEDNALRGALPSELAHLTHLTSLRLTHSRALTGPLPDGLRELTDLTTVQIRDTELCAPDRRRLSSLVGNTLLQEWTDLSADRAIRHRSGGLLHTGRPEPGRWDGSNEGKDRPHGRGYQHGL